MYIRPQIWSTSFLIKKESSNCHRSCNVIVSTSSNSKSYRRCINLIPTQVFASILVPSVRIFSELPGILVSYFLSFTPCLRIHLSLALLFRNSRVATLPTEPEVTALFDFVVHRCEIIRQRNKIVTRALVISWIWKKAKDLREERKWEKEKRNYEDAGWSLRTKERKEDQREPPSGRKLIASSLMTLAL